MKKIPPFFEIVNYPSAVKKGRGQSLGNPNPRATYSETYRAVKIPVTKAPITPTQINPVSIDTTLKPTTPTEKSSPYPLFHISYKNPNNDIFY